ncbi:MAG: hypothetical protein FJ267_06745 [Planctomycetes bacterium]|nr:hypothetical protein [Planctomycetota bacterium]
MKKESPRASPLKKFYFGLIDRVEGDSISLTNVTTQFRSSDAAPTDMPAIETSTGLSLSRSQIEVARKIPPDQVEERIAQFNEAAQSQSNVSKTR